jgi:hypothetical protein
VPGVIISLRGVLLVEKLVAKEFQVLGDIIDESQLPEENVKSLLKTFIVSIFVAIGLKV